VRHLRWAELAQSDKFPLLARTAGRIADHTIQCKITLGGNLASTIIYRETALPLLLADAVLTAAGPQGLKKYLIHEVFRERLRLPKGEFIVGAAVARALIDAPYYHEKKTKNEKIDYPLITTAALIMDGRLRAAFSGLASYPLRDMGVENILNDGKADFAERVEWAAKALDGIVLDDMNGSAGYRRFVLKITRVNILESIKEAKLPCLC
jgi:CO/xanthine dehydrogenase FAD-binding subunit